MKKDYVRTWKASVQPRRQRKYLANAPIHIKAKQLGAHLSEDLSKKYGKRTVRVRKGDRVNIVRGQFRGKDGKVEDVDIQKTRIYVSKVEISKKDGSKTRVPIHPSNVIITELAEDKKRLARLTKE